MCDAENAPDGGARQAPKGPLDPAEFAKLYEGLLVAEARTAAEVDLDFDVARFLARCESPIELALAQRFVLRSRLGGANSWYLSDKGHSSEFLDVASVRARWALDPPVCGWIFVGIAAQSYVPRLDWRVDFLLCTRRKTGASGLLVVECDGHEFHERTPEQAERDRARDRKAQEAGITILRFTGREIWRDADACAEQVGRFIYRLDPVKKEAA